MIIKKFTCLLAAASFFPLCIKAQENSAPAEPDTLPATVAKLASDLDFMRKLKITGYLQAQFQYSDSNGVISFAGGNFPSKVDKRFSVRRGRLKATYEGNMSQFVLQMDVTERGVGIKDAYAKVTEPWAEAVTLQAGIFNRPFGYEISFSSSERESPERGRMSQILFNNERDLGAMITLQPRKSSPWNMLRLDAAILSGTGPTATDFDKVKDFSGRLSLNKTLCHETAKLSAGVSYYDGGFRADTTLSYKMSADTFASEVKKNATSEILKKTYYGADLQFSIEWVAGITTLRAEYIQGVQPSPVAATNPQATLMYPIDVTAAKRAIYKRDFNGAYFYFVQSIGLSKHAIVAKYDWFDPNTSVSSDKVDPANKLTAGDVQFSTLGFGYLLRWNENVKFTFYYDVVTNETTKISGYTKDIKDNIFTARMQFKF